MARIECAVKDCPRTGIFRIVQDGPAHTAQAVIVWEKGDGFGHTLMEDIVVEQVPDIGVFETCPDHRRDR